MENPLSLLSDEFLTFHLYRYSYGRGGGREGAEPSAFRKQDTNQEDVI